MHPDPRPRASARGWDRGILLIIYAGWEGGKINLIGTYMLDVNLDYFRDALILK